MLTVLGWSGTSANRPLTCRLYCDRLAPACIHRLSVASLPALRPRRGNAWGNVRVHVAFASKLPGGFVRKDGLHPRFATRFVCFLHRSGESRILPPAVDGASGNVGQPCGGRDGGMFSEDREEPPLTFAPIRDASIYYHFVAPVALLLGSFICGCVHHVTHRRSGASRCVAWALLLLPTLTIRSVPRDGDDNRRGVCNFVRFPLGTRCAGLSGSAYLHLVVPTSARIATLIGSGSVGQAAMSAASSASAMPPSPCWSLHPALRPAALIDVSCLRDLGLESVRLRLLISGSSVRAREGALSVRVTIQKHPLVDGDRREVPLSAFCIYGLSAKGFRHVRRFAVSLRSHRDESANGRNLRGSFRLPRCSRKNSPTLWFRILSDLANRILSNPSKAIHQTPPVDALQDPGSFGCRHTTSFPRLDSTADFTEG